jgi:hypothetical protein
MPRTLSVVLTLASTWEFNMAALGVLSLSLFEAHSQFLQQSLMVVDLVSGECWPSAAQHQLSLDWHNTMAGGPMLSRAVASSWLHA